MSDENATSSAISNQGSPDSKPQQLQVSIRKGLIMPESKTSIGNRPIASNESEGDDALMGYLD
ncbi:MAG: hypothetical protein AAF268_01300 [Cyanobacteria bacterium P01_A01_bin.3]